MTGVDLPKCVERAFERNTSQRMIRVSRLPGGLSGAEVYYCVDSEGEVFAIKRWPAGVGIARMKAVNEVMMAARVSGCEFVPTSILLGQDEQGYGWEAQSWMPGQPIALDGVPDCELLACCEAGGKAIGMFHASTRHLGHSGTPQKASSTQIAPAVLRRLNRLDELSQLLPQVGVDCLSRIQDSDLRDTMMRVRGLLTSRWTRVRNDLQSELSCFTKHPVSTQMVLRDVHREHILFLEGCVSGLIDFDAVAVDTPWTDLARWAGSLMASGVDRDAIWESVERGYLAGRGEIPPFNVGPISDLNLPSRPHPIFDSSEQASREPGIELAMILCRTTLWVSLGNWLVWLGLENRSFFAGSNAVQKRVNDLLSAVQLG